MKVIITEQQRKHIIHQFIEDLSPNIGKLRKRPTKNMKLGYGYKYFDPKTKDVLFHVVSGGPVYWEGGGVTRPKYPGVRLYVETNLYNQLKSYFGNFDEPLLKWFNETYKQDADNVIEGIVWW
jgi:hypothetical protein